MGGGGRSGNIWVRSRGEGTTQIPVESKDMTPKSIILKIQKHKRLKRTLFIRTKLYSSLSLSLLTSAEMSYGLLETAGGGGCRVLMYLYDARF